jgi:tRNA(adenine34) deaminase
MIRDDQHYMQHALGLAKQAALQGEVPVGAVLVKDDEVIAEAYNQPIALNDPSAHAEIQVLRKAGEQLKNYRLLDCTLYVTLEPCLMCVGAMVHARIKRLVFGAFDPKTGACGSVWSVLGPEKNNSLNHQISIEGGVLAEEAGALLREFFKNRR